MEYKDRYRNIEQAKERFQEKAKPWKKTTYENSKKPCPHNDLVAKYSKWIKSRERDRPCLERASTMRFCSGICWKMLEKATFKSLIRFIQLQRKETPRLEWPKVH